VDRGDVPGHLLAEIGHFFEVYKALEPSKSTETGQWGTRREALDEIAAAKRRHAAHLHQH
jgi:inorganic pyrophosphatase